ncbi:MAG: biotin carboxylase [Myxococcota bacterium]|jgi:biotin carboxylase
MNVLFLAPNYPSEMQQYTRGLAEVGARVHGIGEAALESFPESLKSHLTSYLQVPRLLDEDDVIKRVHAWTRGHDIARVEGLWEPVVILAARLRERLGVPGMSVDTVRGFRDKQLMKERVAAAELRVPHSFKCGTEAEVRKAAKACGFPLIVKPIDGAGSADTYRVDGADELKRVITAVRHVREVSVEEFIDGEEFTYDAICVDGKPVYENVAQYLPRPLIARSNEWISPVIITIRDLKQPPIAEGIEFGRKVVRALDMGTGFVHMEWYRTAAGEVVFGEIGCRPGGAHLVDQMNFTSDVDLFREWARAVCHRRIMASRPRAYNVAIIFKRAQGKGRISRIDGLQAFGESYGQYVVADTLLPVGTLRRNWKNTLLSDGFLILRHPDFAEANRIADAAATQITMYAE